MIFAHGPAGFLTAATIARWFEHPTKRQWLLVCLAGFIGGIFPDIDLFYFYLIDGSQSHRYFITHTFVPYVIAAAVLLPVLFGLQRRFAGLVAAVFLIGTCTHLLTDSIVAQTRLLYPFSDTFFSLVNLPFPALSANAFLLIFLFEGILITLFFALLIRRYIVPAKRLRWEILLWVVFCVGVVSVGLINTHVFQGPRNLYYADTDGDGTINVEDSDMDGDGLLNTLDPDSDGDGISNAVEIIELREQFVGNWYDPTNGGFIQIPLRFGFLTTASTPDRLYSAFGAALRPEMEVDYALNPSGYVLRPTSSEFTENTTNVFAWLEHTKRLTTSDVYTLGDIVLFNSGHTAIAVGFTELSEPLFLDVHPDRPVGLRLLPELEGFEGALIQHGHVLANK